MLIGSDRGWCQWRIYIKTIEVLANYGPQKNPDHKKI